MPAPQNPVNDDELTSPAKKSPVPWLVGGFLALLTLFLVVGTLLAGDDQEAEGDPAPEVSFELLTGGDSSLQQFRGTPTVVNFFASWCAPCVRELPDFETTSQAYAGQVDFLGLSVSDRRDDTERLLEETGVTFEIGLDPNGDIHREISELGVMPTTIFLAADGSIVSVHAGSMSADDLASRIQAELLSGDSDQ